MAELNPHIKKLSFRGATTYTASWHTDAGKQEKIFDRQADAEAFIEELKRAHTGVAEAPAESGAALFSPGELEVVAAKLRTLGKDLRTVVQEYAYAVKLLQPYGLGLLEGTRELSDALFELKASETPLGSAIFEYTEARKALGPVPLFDAVRAYKKAAANPEGLTLPPFQAAAPAKPKVPEKTVPELVEEYLAAKGKEGLEEEEVLDQRTRLKRLVAAFPGPIRGEIFFSNEEWLESLPLSGASKMRLQELVLDLGRFAKKKAYL